MELNKSKVSYRNEAMHNYMVIETSDIESTNFREKMITENDITGILSTKITKIKCYIFLLVLLMLSLF